MNKRKTVLTVLVALSVALVTVLTTTALLTSYTGPLENVFTFGKVDISLEESTGAGYKLIPGTTVKKDPTVTVVGGSEDCWLFIEVNKTADFDKYLVSEIADGWTLLGGHPGIYYRYVIMSHADTEFPILKNNTVSVRDDLTEEKMSTISEIPAITFKAYAIQRHSIDNAADAWNFILQEGRETE